jgi:Ca2+-binding RTX toxin-like protein
MTTRDRVLQAAQQHIGEIWGNQNCTGLVFTVSVDVNAPIFYPNDDFPRSETGPFGSTSSTLLNDTSTKNSFKFNVPVFGPDGAFSADELGAVHAQSDIYDNAWKLVNGTHDNFTTIDKNSPATEPQPGDIFFGVVERSDGTMQVHQGIVQSYDPAADTLTIIDDFAAFRQSNGFPSGGALIEPTTFNLGPLQPPGNGNYIITGDFALYRLTETITGGGTGNAFIDASTGYQSIIGGGGNTTIWGGAGDTIQGGAGNVTIGGGSGDTIFGGTDNYFIDVHLGNQLVIGGGGGNGTIWGGAGDTIQGGAGNVTIGGGAGNTIVGGMGDTFIDGHLGSQSITGGSGGNTTVWGGSGDTIRGGSAGNQTIGGVAGDTIIGSDRANVFIDGSTGYQSIIGGSGGNTTVWGGAGDTILGGAGNQTIGGGAGDTIIGGSSSEVFIDGHLGHQSITGGSGNTTIWGGAGDTIQGAGAGGNATIAFGTGRVAGQQQTYWDNGTTSSGNDTIYDFTRSIDDRISLNGPTDSAAAVAATATADSSGNAVLHLSDGSSITLVGLPTIDNTFFTTR